jgi:hypothetical protein
MNDLEVPGSDLRADRDDDGGLQNSAYCARRAAVA